MFSRTTALVCWLVMAAVVITVVVVAGCSGSGSDASVKVAGNLALTGPIAAFCGQYPEGFRMGMERGIEDEGLAADSFGADFQDHAGDPATAVTVMQKQLMSRPNIYISGPTQMSEPLMSEIGKQRIPHFLVSFDAFMTHGRENTLRVLPNFKIEAPLFVDYIRSKKAERVFFFTPNLRAYVEQSDELIIPALEEMGVEYRRELFEFEHKDYRPIAEKAGKFNPDVIVVSGYAFHVYPILRALREFGLTEKCSVICTLDFIDLLRSDTPIDDLKGVAFTSPRCEIPGEVPGYAEWREDYVERYGTQPSYVDAYAYDTARIIARAYKLTGRVDTESILQAVPFDGIVGRIELDGERDLRSTLVIGQVRSDGEIQQVILTQP